MNRKIGFIGCGKMAGAIIKGIIAAGFLPKENIKGAEINCETAQLAQNSLGIEVCRDNRALAAESDVVFIAVKPNYTAGVLEEIKDVLAGKLVVSIAAGVSVKKIEGITGEVRVIRVMPNTPALVLEGMSAAAKGTYASDCDMEFVISLLSSIGKAVEVDEKQMDIVTAISGSGPAFFYKVIEDIARAGEKLGLDYEKALLLAAQTAFGSAKMALGRGELSLENLIGNVATKGGCTFEGIEVMKAQNSDRLFFDVIEATAQKACKLAYTGE
ncbi:MAG: pyrroline-5-carboxylate reductase [Heliobacteriaceae bacterium]|jgi:pyrroline-5-carboxylate reductase|nr:pyrroline-5-carboxylate reductase [Heliobacteriaceae bacterium]